MKKPQADIKTNKNNIWNGSFPVILAPVERLCQHLIRPSSRENLFPI